jgi:3-oxoacyl-[acyl-carrier protein] reductase
MDLDLGIRGRRAIVCGASKGLGKACAMALAKAGVSVTINGRHRESLDKVAEEIKAMTGVDVIVAPADTATREGRAALMAAGPMPDILVTNSGGPPAGNFSDWDEEKWEAAIRTNMLAAIMLIRAVLDAMAAKRWGRIINITSYAVKMPLPLLSLSNGARSGLTGVVAGLAREVGASGITINNLLPGPFDTERLQAYAARLGQDRNCDSKAVLAEMAASNPTRRIGKPEEFGTWCAILASEHSGYLTGQNLVLDGGSYPGVL